MNEFDLIRSIRHLADELPANGFEGIGDDCAVLPLGDEALVFTTDALIEGVHFLRHATSPRELGHKALAVNLSDVAAMGVRPVAVLLSISLPTTIDEAWAAEFMDGFTALAKAHGVALIGGDTTRSERDIALSVTAIGRGATAALKRRSDAHVGDTILVSDSLGGSAAGLRDILADHLDTPSAAIHRNPQPEIEVGAWLGTRTEVHAMMDLSDGLASDLRHIINASKVGAEIDIDHIPVAEGATTEDALCGGEDYKLLLTADRDAVAQLCTEYEAHFGHKLHPIGHIVSAERGICWKKQGCETNSPTPRFSHF